MNRIDIKPQNIACDEPIGRELRVERLSRVEQGIMNPGIFEKKGDMDDV
jgi:hypothetical protein